MCLKQQKLHLISIFWLLLIFLPPVDPKFVIPLLPGQTKMAGTSRSLPCLPQVPTPTGADVDAKNIDSRPLDERELLRVRPINTILGAVLQQWSQPQSVHDRLHKAIFQSFFLSRFLQSRHVSFTVECPHNIGGIWGGLS